MNFGYHATNGSYLISGMFQINSTHFNLGGFGT
jgi:hypothetical protein